MVRLTRCLAIIPLLLLPTMVCALTQEKDSTGVSDPSKQESRFSEATGENAARRVVLERRVVARWDALIHRDFASVYMFTSPAYREAFSLDAFKRNFGNGRVAWQRIEVVSVDFKGNDAATVGIKIHIVYHDPQSQKSLDMATHDQESWVYADGQWWYLVKG